jgi:hypothetical protein
MKGRVDIVHGRENSGRKPNGAFGKSANGFVRRGRAVQSHAAKYLEFVIQAQANVRDVTTLDAARDDRDRLGRIARSEYRHSLDGAKTRN